MDETRDSVPIQFGQRRGWIFAERGSYAMLPPSKY